MGNHKIVTSDQEIEERIYDLGMAGVKIPDLSFIDELRADLGQKAAELTGAEFRDLNGFLEGFHNHLKDYSQLNAYRVSLIEFLNDGPKYKKKIFDAFKPQLELLLGCDIAVQKRINMVVQVPNYPDETLQMHSDVEGGNSPFEITLWIPLVDVCGSKSMFVLDRKIAGSVVEAMEKYQGENLIDLGKKLVKKENYVSMKYGEALLFSPFLLHGNSENLTNETRWALNIRFKGLFTPYGTKGFGEFFEPIKTSPLSRLGLEYYKKHSGLEYYKNTP